MKITLEFLEKHDACQVGIDFFKKKFGDEVDHKIIAKELITTKRYQWIYWGISNILIKTNRIKFAIYCAESILFIYEKKYPNDNRPRKAIEAAKADLKNPSKATAAAAADAAAAATDAYAYAGYTAIHAAYADKTIAIKIVKYGLKLINEQEKTNGK